MTLPSCCSQYSRNHCSGNVFAAPDFPTTVNIPTTPTGTLEEGNYIVGKKTLKTALNNPLLAKKTPKVNGMSASFKGQCNFSQETAKYCFKTYLIGVRGWSEGRGTWFMASGEGRRPGSRSTRSRRRGTEASGAVRPTEWKKTERFPPGGVRRSLQFRGGRTSARTFETAGKCSNMDGSSKFKNCGVTKGSNFENI